MYTPPRTPANIAGGAVQAAERGRKGMGMGENYRSVADTVKQPVSWERSSGSCLQKSGFQRSVLLLIMEQQDVLRPRSANRASSAVKIMQRPTTAPPLYRAKSVGWHKAQAIAQTRVLLSHCKVLNRHTGSGHGRYLSTLRSGVRQLAVGAELRTVHRVAAENRHHEAMLAPGTRNSKRRVSLIMEVESLRELQAIPMWKQGDETLATAEMTSKRQRLRYDGDVLGVLQQFWEAAQNSLKSDGEDVPPDELHREGYARLMRRVYRLLIEDYEEEDVESSIAEDWAKDARGEQVLTRVRFCDAVFEIADMWTSGVSSAEYTSFLRRLFERVTTAEEEVDADGNVRTVAYVWKNFQECGYDESFAEDGGDDSDDASDEDAANAEADGRSTACCDASDSSVRMPSTKFAKQKSRPGPGALHFKLKAMKQKVLRISAIGIQAIFRGLRGRRERRQRKAASNTITRRAAKVARRHLASRLTTTSGQAPTRGRAPPSPTSTQARTTALDPPDEEVAQDGGHVRKTMVWPGPVRPQRLSFGVSWTESTPRRTSVRYRLAFGGVVSPSPPTRTPRHVYRRVPHRPWGTHSERSSALTPWNPPTYRPPPQPTKLPEPPDRVIGRYGLSPRRVGVARGHTPHYRTAPHEPPPSLPTERSPPSHMRSSDAPKWLLSPREQALAKAEDRAAKALSEKVELASAHAQVAGRIDVLLERTLDADQAYFRVMVPVA